MNQPDSNSRPMLRWFAKLVWPLAALAVLLLFNFAFTPGFFHLEIKNGHLYGSLVDVLKQAAPVMLLSLGMTLVIATAGVDLSVGATVAIAGSAAAKLLIQQQMALPTVVLATLVLCVALGAWNGTLIAWLGVQPIVATLILMVAGRGIAQLLTGGQIITVEHRGFSFIAGGHFLALPFPLTVVCMTLLVTVALTRWTAMGLFIESVGNNETASRFAGVNDRVWAVSAEGKKLWDQAFTWHDFFEAPPLILKDGSICHISRYGMLMCLDPEMNLQWMYYLNGHGSASPAVGRDGTLYISSGSVEFFALSNAKPLGETPWPKFRGNSRNTGNAADR